MLVRHHLVADLDRIASHDREHGRGQAGLVENVGECYCSERSLFARLDHHPIVSGDRGGHFVCYLVERMIEGCDSRDCSLQRLAQGVNLALLTVWADVAGEYLSVIEDAGLA